MAGVFQCNVFQQNVFQNDCSASPSVTTTTASGPGCGAPPIRDAWLNWWESQKAFEELLRDDPKIERDLGPEHKRLLRRLKMHEEMLFDAGPVETRRIEAKMKAIRAKIAKMEWN